jgi:DNA-binding transcriptional LysR family regulator
MNSFDIRAINLNLLPALDALLAETSVSAAAARTGVSQSAMSHSLARLRELLDDPLLVSAGRQMVPTARAQALAGPLRAALEQLRGALAAGAPFDPATAERQLAIAAFDYFEMIAVPELVAFLGRRAPNMTLRIERLSPAVTRRLVAGELDMVLDMADAAMPPSL